MTTILMEGGNRVGRTLSRAKAIRAKLDEGHRVLVSRNGIFFDCLPDGDGLKFVALTEKPSDLETT